jgi:hypothetical protein
MHKKTRTVGELTYTVTYGFDLKFAAKHKQRPYFSITLDTEENGEWVSSGQQPETIAEVFPELVHVLQWHMADNSATPVHYVPNTLYWRDHFPTQAELEVFEGEPAIVVTLAPKYEDGNNYGHDKLASHLKSCMAWGSLQCEREWTGDSPETWDRDALHAYLVTRQGALMACMQSDLAAVGVTIPEVK